jgi:hypothetical protein
MSLSSLTYALPTDTRHSRKGAVFIRSTGRRAVAGALSDALAFYADFEIAARKVRGAFLVRTLLRRLNRANLAGVIDDRSKQARIGNRFFLNRMNEALASFGERGSRDQEHDEIF